MQHEDALKRLRTVEGHIRGIQRMLEEDAYCIDVIKQIQAVQAALNRINSAILNEHMNSCVTTALHSDDLLAREKVLSELSQVFETKAKI